MTKKGNKEEALSGIMTIVDELLSALPVEERIKRLDEASEALAKGRTSDSGNAQEPDSTR